MNVSGTMNSATGHTSVSTRTGNFNDGLYDKAGARPDLDLDFARTKSLKDRVSKEDLITFSRSSGSTGYGATYVDESGLVKRSPVNIMPYSSDISSSSFVAVAPGVANDAYAEVVLATDQGTAPDGSSADAFKGTGETGRHTLRMIPTIPQSNTQYVMSIFVKKLKGTTAEKYVALETAIWGTWATTGSSGAFDLDTGTRISNPNSGISSGIEDFGNGWYRIYFVATTASATTSTGFYLNASASTGAVGSTTLASDEGFLVWGAQMEVGSVPTTYIPTNGQASGAPRFTHDPETLESKGLLIEQQATNLSKPNRMIASSITRVTMNSLSEQAAGQNTNGVVSPDGTAVGVARAHFTGNESAPTGDVYFFNRTGTGSPYIQTTFTTTGTHTSSVFVKPALETLWQLTAHDTYASTSAGGTAQGVGATFTLTGNGTVTAIGTGMIAADIKKYLNGWYRLSITYHRNSTSTVHSAYGVLLYPKTHQTYNQFTSNTGLTSGELGYFWGPQVETGAVLTSYIPTNDAEATRSPDLASIEGDNFGTYRKNVVTNTSFRKASDGYLLTGPNANATYESYAGISPSGNYDALKITATSATGTHRILQYVTLDDSSVYSVSAYVKAGTSDKCIVNLWDGDSNVGTVRADLTAETATNISGVNVTNISITDVGNGWYLIEFTSISTTVSGAPAVIVSVLNASNAQTYAGNGESIFVWGMQAVKANTPSPFIPSTDTYTNRQSNATFVDGNGIVRTSLVNYVKYSEDIRDNSDGTDWNHVNLSVTPNNAIAPDGTLTADTPSNHMTRFLVLHYQTGGGSSFIVGENVPIVSEWQRFSHTFTVPSTGNDVRLYPLRSPSSESTQRFVHNHQSHNITLVAGKTYTYSAWYKTINGVNHVWGIQLVKGTEAGDYYKTTGTISGPPRYSHDPETLTPTGLYLEAKSTNDAIDTERFGSAYQAGDTSDVYIAGPYHYSSSTRKTETGITNPDGSTDGTTVLTVNSGTQNRTQPRGFRLPNIASLVGRSVTSVFVKRKTSTARYVVLFLGGTGTYQQCLFDFDTETVVENAAPHNLPDHQQYNATDRMVERGVVKYPNGWYRLYLIIDVTGPIAGNGYGVGLAKDPATSKSVNQTDDGPYDGTEAIYVWGLNRCSADDVDSSNVPQETNLSSYIKNSTITASSVARTPDTFTSTATEVLDKANGTKPAFFTRNGVSVFVDFKLNNQKLTPTTNNALYNSHTYNSVINLSQSNTSIFSMMPDLYAHWTTPPEPRLSVFTGSPTNIFLAQNYTEDADVKSALRFQENNSQFATNTLLYGGLGGGDTSVTIESPNILNIGKNTNSVNQINGTINRLTFWKTPFVDSKLQRLTS